MIELMFLIIFEFFKTGLFAVGGGLATIPFLAEMGEKYGWFTMETLSTMIAISESTPGPMGINMATYVGYSLLGVLGSLLSTLSIVAPSIIVICIIANYFEKFKNAKIVKEIFNGLKPAVIAFIIAACLDLFLKTLEDFNLGDPIEYIFLQEGNHRFNLSRTNAAAAADYFLRLANTLLSALGIDLSNDGMILDLGNMLNQRLIYMSAGVSNPSFDKELWANTAYEIVLKWSEKHGLRLLAANTAKMLTSAFNWYDKIKGGISLALRLAYAIDAPAEVRFCLCFHDGYLSTCTNANLEKIDGDGQKGYAMQKLLLPLKVKVTTYDEDGKELAPGEFHRVKFEVTSGGGKIETELVAADTCGFASTNWTLGKEGVQRIKASVIDVITEQEIAMPVYFTASIEKADVTVRLDWTKVDEYTDIDLHVIDPFGERIFFDNPTSVSGGFLDRDDTEGPGPEHIHWDNAPAGTYKIYVHYYDSESAAMTTYKVSVTAAGVTYKPVTGSITYDQMVPIGQFVIGENSSTTTKAEIVKKQNMTVDGLKPIGKTKKITLKNTTAKIDRK